MEALVFPINESMKGEINVRISKKERDFVNFLITALVKLDCI